MRIAQVAPLTESVPPRLYGGTERVVSFLTEQLVAMGHEVTLFASGDSRTSAELVPIWPRALRFDPSLRDAIAPHMLLMEEVCSRADEFDVLHSHLDYWPFSLFSRQQTPFLTTLHGRLDLPELQPVYDNFPECAAGVHFRCAALSTAAGQFHRNRASWVASRSADPRPVDRATWRSSAGSARKSGRTAPSVSPARPAFR